MVHKLFSRITLYSLGVEHCGLFHGSCPFLHHLSDLFDHFWWNRLAFAHQPQDNLPLLEDDSAARQQVFWKSIVLIENINLEEKNIKQQLTWQINLTKYREELLLLYLYTFW